MKIEMGKKYQTKDGNPVRILCVDREHSDYCVVGLRATKTCGEQMSSWTVEGHFRKGEDNEDDLVEVVEPVMLSQEQLDDIRGNLRIYDNRVCERDVVSLLRHIAALEAEFAAAKAECERLRKLAKQFAETNTKLRRIACHVPGRAWMKASEECGYGNTVSINDHKIDEAWLEFTSVKPKEPTP